MYSSGEGKVDNVVVCTLLKRRVVGSEVLCTVVQRRIIDTI